MYGKDILCVISKVPFEIPHKISCPYMERWGFYTMLRIWHVHGHIYIYIYTKRLNKIGKINSVRRVCVCVCLIMAMSTDACFVGYFYVKLGIFVSNRAFLCWFCCRNRLFCVERALYHFATCTGLWNTSNTVAQRRHTGGHKRRPLPARKSIKSNFTRASASKRRCQSNVNKGIPQC